jgi:hypothetical protein
MNDRIPMVEKKKSLINLQSFSNDLYLWYKNYLLTYYMAKSFNLKLLHILPSQVEPVQVEPVQDEASVIQFRDYPHRKIDLNYCMLDSNWVRYHTTIDDHTDKSKCGHPGPKANENTGRKIFEILLEKKWINK